jgi:type II secretory pathway component PulM
MNTLVWHLRRIGLRLGATGLIGLACVALALLLYAAGTRPHEARITAQQTQLDALQRRTQAPERPQPQAVAADPLDTLPPAGEVARQIGVLERLARAHGIELPRGQYGASAQAHGSVQHWTLTLPVETSYPALHAWLADALAHMPNLALDEVKLKRERIEARTVQAELRLSLYLEAAP